MKAETYRLFLNGRYIRKSTRVVFADGSKIEFMDLMPKRQALAQAAAMRQAGR